MSTTSRLNPEQAVAVAHDEGPMIVLAGPGTGKTECLTKRYVRLRRERGIPAEQILVQSFTRKAAAMLRQRIAAEIDEQPPEHTIGTFHSFALALIREGHAAFGDRTGWRVAGEDACRAVGEQTAGEHDIDVDDLMMRIERAKDRLCDPKAAAAEAEAAEVMQRPALRRFAKAYARYQARLAAARLLDFGDLGMLLVRGLERDPDFLAALGRRFRYVMVDEYQDLNLVQEEFVRLMFRVCRNIWVVGDDDQAIYGFRGSDIKRMLSFPTAYPGTRTVRLVRNYRSSGLIVNAAAAMIARNRYRVDKRLVAQRGIADETIAIHRAANPFEEASWIGGRIAEFVADGVDPGEMAVLFRVAHGAGMVEQALATRGVRQNVAGITQFWRLSEVDLVLRLIQELTVERFLRRQSDRAVPPTLLREVAHLRGRPFREVAAAVLRLVMARPPRSAGQGRREAWQATLETLRQVIDAAGSPDRLAQRIEGGDVTPWEEAAPGAENGVFVGTIHAAKGLEWDVVFIAGCEEGILPHAKATDLEEERRLAFVAATRARRKLTFTWCEERGRQPAELSSFLVDLCRRMPEGLVQAC